MTDANEAPAATPDAAPAGVPVAAPDAAPAGVPLEPGVHSPGYSGKGTPVGGGGAAAIDFCSRCAMAGGTGVCNASCRNISSTLANSWAGWCSD